MGAAKWIRFAVLLSFACLFFFLAYTRGETLWTVPAVVFGALSALTLRLREQQ